MIKRRAGGRIRVALLAGCLLAAITLPGKASAAVALQPAGTFAEPIYATSPPGDTARLFVVERGGTIAVVKNGSQLPAKFLDISTIVDSAAGTERGLLSMAFDPNYASNGLFYVFFNDNGTGGGGSGEIHVDEFHVSANPDVADSGSRRPVLSIPHSATNHNGGQLQFGRDGLLYISVGENATPANAQTLANPLGKLLRIDPHGAIAGAHGIPADNPFAVTPGAVPEIYSLGLRNPWRFSFDRLTGDIAIADVGGGQFEEVDFATPTSGLARGANFGWPNCEGFSGSGCGTTFVNPVFSYPHNGPVCDAITGGYVYRGSQVPELAGRYLYADLCDGELRSLQLGLPLASGDRSEGAPALGSPTSFGEDANCELYVTDGGNVLNKIVSTAPPAVAPACATQPAAAKKKCKRKKKKRRRKKGRLGSASGEPAVSAARKKHKKKRRCKKRKKKRKQHQRN